MGPKLNIDEENINDVTPLEDELTAEEITELTAAKDPFEDELKIAALEEVVEDLNKEIEILTISITLLKQYIAENGLKPFGGSTLDKAPQEMTKQEIIERNKISHSQRRVNSLEAIKPLTPAELIAHYAPATLNKEAQALADILSRKAE